MVTVYTSTLTLIPVGNTGTQYSHRCSNMAKPHSSLINMKWCVVLLEQNTDLCCHKNIVYVLEHQGFDLRIYLNSLYPKQYGKYYNHAVVQK